MSNLLELASIILTPTAYSADTLHCIKPNTATGDFNFDRNTTSTRVNSSGNVEALSANLPRIDYTGGTGHISLEPQSTNLFLNSATLSTQSVTTTAASHTISFYGTGSITLSGTHSATINGTGANNRVSLTFTPSSGSLNCTVSGTVTNAQIEALAFATSYIPTTGAMVTRSVDAANGAGSNTLINGGASGEGVIYAEIAAFTSNPGVGNITLSDNSQTKRIVIGFGFSANQILCSINNGSTFPNFLSFQTITDVTAYNKIALKYKLNDISLYINGVEVATDTSSTIPTLQSLQFDNGYNGANQFFGKVKCVAIYKTALTDSQLQCLTS